MVSGPVAAIAASTAWVAGVASSSAKGVQARCSRLPWVNTTSTSGAMVASTALP